MPTSRLAARRGSTLASTALVIAFIALAAATAVKTAGDGTENLLIRIAASTNAVDGQLSGNAGPRFTGTLPAPAEIALGKALTFAVDGFVDPEGDPLDYSLHDGGSGLAATLSLIPTGPGGVSIAGEPPRSGTFSLTVRATDPIGRQVEAGPITVEVAQAPQSCLEILANDGAAPSGVYRLDPAHDDAGFDAYCVMADQDPTHGGGWTMVFAGYEADAISGWNEGRQGDYDPTLSSQRAFALAGGEIPPHTQVGFGRDLDPTFIDATTAGSGFTYGTGDIPVTLVTGLSGKTYQIHRSSNHYYASHDPEAPAGTTTLNPHWFNTLTFDETGGAAYSWAYAADAHDVLSPTYTGYAMNANLQESPQSYAWTLWVR